MLRSILVLFAAFLLSLPLSRHAAGATPVQVDRPNIILLFADDMGYGDLSSFGSPTIVTPHLDRMADEGVRLTSFYAAASVCSPSRVGLMTGRYPVRTSLPHNIGPNSGNGLSPQEVTIAELLNEQGYRTMAIGKWHIGHGTPEMMPTGQGFDAYLGLLYSNDMIPPWVKTDRPLELYRDLAAIEEVIDQSSMTMRYTEAATSFIEESVAADQPFFLYLPYAMPHVPLNVSMERQGLSRAGLYGDVIEEIDWSVGRILETIAEAGIEEETIIVFTSDNGPWSNMPDRMFSEDIVKPWDAGSAGPLRGSKATAWEGGFRVPFVARWTGHLPEGKVSADPASTLDLYTTLARLGGADVPSDRAVDGIDLLPFLQGEHDSPRSQFFYFMGERLEAVREGPWKYHVDRGELYHLDIDPGERFDVAERYPEVVAELTSLASQAPERDWVGR